MRRSTKVVQAARTIPINFNRGTSTKLLFTLLALVFCFGPLSWIAEAEATYYWTNKEGSADNFDWSGGGSETGLFGSPTIVGGNTFLFFPSNFRAESLDGVSEITYDKLEFNLAAHSGYTIKGMVIHELGDYGISGTGEVSVSGTMFLTNLSEWGVYSDNLVSTPSSPITSGSGQWSAEVGVDGLDWTNLNVTLNNNLIARSDPGSEAFIEKSVAGVAIEIIIIPEPATICIVGLGGLMLVRRKKRLQS